MSGKHKFAFGKKSDAKYIKTIGQYKLGNVIGEGASCLVRFATDANSNPFAVKIIPKVSLANKRAFHQFQTEIGIMRKLNHPGVIRLTEFLKDRLFYYVVMEYLAGESLWHRITRKRKLPLDEARTVLRQLLTALDYVHSLDVCHCDLKPENILFDAKGNCKIIDFGLAHSSANGMCSKPRGTVGYMSPEALSGKPYDGKASDVWSVGVILYSMVLGGLPWSSWNEEQMSGQIRRGRYDIPTHLGPDVERVLRGTLEMSPDKRMTVQELLADPWISNSEMRLLLTPTKPKRTSQPATETTGSVFHEALDEMRKERRESTNEKEVALDSITLRITEFTCDLRKTRSSPICTAIDARKTEKMPIVKCGRVKTQQFAKKCQTK